MPDVEKHLFGAYRIVSESAEERRAKIDAMQMREFHAQHLYLNAIHLGGVDPEIRHRFNRIAIDTTVERIKYDNPPKHYLLGIPVLPIFRHIRDAWRDFNDECDIVAADIRSRQTSRRLQPQS